MNPRTSHFSIGCPLSGNATHCHRSPLPRSFKLPGHEIRFSGPYSALLMAHQRPSFPQCGECSQGHSRASHGDTFALYSTFFERSLRMQHARQRNAKAHLGIVKGFRKGRGNTFFRLGKKRKKRGSRGRRQKLTPYLII